MSILNPKQSSVKGRYIYFLENKHEPIDETFELDAQPGQWQINSQRTAYGTQQKVKATVTATGISRCDLHWRNFERKENCRIQYYADKRGISWHRSSPQASETQQQTMGEMDIDDVFIVFPLMRIFTGIVFDAILANDGQANVIAPNIGQKSTPDDRYLPQTNIRALHLHSPNCYGYTGGEHDDARFWLSTQANSQGFLERYTWQQPKVGLWRSELELD